MQTQSNEPIRRAETAKRNMNNLLRWAGQNRERLNQIAPAMRRERQRRGLLLLGRTA